MKHLITGLVAAFGLTFTPYAHANGYYGHKIHTQHRHFHHHPHHVNRYNWVAPAIIGGAVTYALTRPYIVEQPVVVQQIPQMQQPAVVHCTEWKEVMQPNGTIVQERTCTQR